MSQFLVSWERAARQSLFGGRIFLVVAWIFSTSRPLGVGA